MWQLAREICIDLEDLFLETPLGKRFSLMNSWTGETNMDTIADGFGRGRIFEFRNFLGSSKGSCSSFRSQLYWEKDKKLISLDKFEARAEKCDKENVKIGSFKNYLCYTEYK